VSALCFRSAVESCTDCIDSVADGMRSNRLQLNPAKTEFLWCSSARRKHQASRGRPVGFVLDLVIYVDADLSMRNTFRELHEGVPPPFASSAASAGQ